ncbi:endonuclease domain-containing protein [Microbacterium hominis]|uniref:DUF559 domain-containing protein n=1 Tax=Microbacterium hominis TaxID=162426 RepID=A0A7D4U2W4_9MICO|nr:DUF559 domain-containing protein [Microbacterium hominis]QKJ18225.1 DUF559 domain-containing protein [Microbacterium hominis]
MASPLPDELGDRFSVADALARGVLPSRLRGKDLEQHFHGARSRVASDDPRLHEDRSGMRRGELEREHLARALTYATRMSDGAFFSHVTAAVLWDVPLPGGLIRNAPVDVAVFKPVRLSRARGVRGHQAAAATTRVRVHPTWGVRLTAPATTWAMLGSVLRRPEDLVAAGDAVVRDWRVNEALASLEDLRHAIYAGRRVGVQQLREAIPDLRTRSASRQESRLRLCLMGAGLPEPDLNFDVFENGIKIACVDLAYPHLRIAIEYEGEHHLLDPEQWARDIRRYEQLEAAGWRVIRVTKAELAGDRRALLARVRAAIAGRS